MSKKAIYTVSGIFFAKSTNAKAEAEKNGDSEKPKKSFVTEEEFLTMLEDGLIVDFDLEQPTEETQEPEQTKKEDILAEEIGLEDIMKRLKALEEENKQLKAEQPRKKLSFEEIQKAIERRELLQEEANELLEIKEQFETLKIDETDRFSKPELYLKGVCAAGDQAKLSITNPLAIKSVVQQLVVLVDEKVISLLDEITTLEKTIA